MKDEGVVASLRRCVVASLRRCRFVCRFVSSFTPSLVGWFARLSSTFAFRATRYVECDRTDSVGGRLAPCVLCSLVELD